MADHVVYTGFDPEFGDRLNRLIALAKAQGYAPNLISGTRSAYGWPGMKGQSQDELYSQLGKPGGPRAAAPPGYSPHQYGLASDVAGIPQSVLERLAPEVGLQAIHSDPNHVQLANWQGEAARQPQMTAWDETNPANVPSRMAMNMEGGGPSQPSRPATTTPGLTLNSSPMDLVANLESGNRNIPQNIHDINTDRGTPAGGYFQIIDPTWQRYAGPAGVDVKQYPTAMSAPRDIQAQVASAIPVSQWGPNTVNALKAKYPGINTSQTLGAFQSAAINPSGASTAVAGGSPLATALSGVGKALGGGGGAAAAPATPQSPLTKALSSAGKDLGGGAGGSGGDEQPPSMPPMQLAPPMASGGPMMMGAGGQNSFGRGAAQQMLAQQGFQTQPSLQYGGANAMSSPIGAPSPGGTPIGAATGIPGLPGTTLNSPSQLQMALMMGQWPYAGQQQQDPYGGMNYG